MRRVAFSEDDYLEKLWTCYQQGVEIEKLDPKDLFTALVKDLIEQLED